MNRKVELGAPSLTGKDVNDQIAAEFGKAKYPLKVMVANQMPRDVVFPELNLFLRHVAAAEGTEAEIEIPNHEVFQRFASDVEQIAELNQYAQALVVEEVYPVKKSFVDAQAAPAPTK
jgi:hypothetical protein